MRAPSDTPPDLCICVDQAVAAFGGVPQEVTQNRLQRSHRIKEHELYAFLSISASPSRRARTAPKTSDLWSRSRLPSKRSSILPGSVVMSRTTLDSSTLEAAPASYASSIVDVGFATSFWSAALARC